VTPSYAELPNGDAAGVFGESDVLGSLNRIDRHSVLRGTAAVVDGTVFSLNAPLDWPDPPLFGRRPVEHTVLVTPRGNLDDYLDTFYPQASSQWDGFLHVRDPELGTYNRRSDDELGIEVWAERGIAGRGVLLDLERHLRGTAAPLDWRRRDVITADHLTACADAQGVRVQPGDVLLIRTGWAGHVDDDCSELPRDASGVIVSPGLDGSETMAARLWDWGIGALAADNPAMEATPFGVDRLHPKLLGRLGIPIGELWLLDDLAAACAADGRYEFLLTSAPLNVPGGVGSPANVLAIR
jgi:kynurenine formamidase